jgi:hypothetical protein
MKSNISTFILVILALAFFVSIRHIFEAWRKRDHEAIGEGVGGLMASSFFFWLNAF